jgi:hypothetical protein
MSLRGHAFITVTAPIYGDLYSDELDLVARSLRTSDDIRLNSPNVWPKLAPWPSAEVSRRSFIGPEYRVSVVPAGIEPATFPCEMVCSSGGFNSCWSGRCSSVELDPSEHSF